MLPFFKKDFLVYWRDRKEMAIALLTPIVIIMVLGFAMPNWVENPTGDLDLKVAVVTEDDAEDGLERFRNSLDALPLAPEETSSLAVSAERLLPSAMLMQLLESEEVRAFVSAIELDEEAAMRQLEDGDVSAIVTFPEGYTLSTLNKWLLNEGEGMAVALTAEQSSTEVDMLRNLLEGFMQTVNLQAAIGFASGGEAAASNSVGLIGPVGGRETIEGFEMVTSFQYYTLAIGVVFSLFVAMTTALKAATERKERVFHRIVLTGSHPIRYLSGKIGSTFCMALLQMTFIFIVCHFILDLFPARTVQFWLGLAMVALVFCFSVASLSAVFTSLAFRLEEATAGGVMTIILMMIGTVGGSFVPRFVLPQWIQLVGEWTPNGRALSAFLQWVQQGSPEVVAAPLLQLLAFSLAAIGASILLFPRRGRI
ncbi:ABC transporter permease [Paenibacillus arenilitoris]|uniref:ABC transporter permease n=1 Tax=Paenibacillus arenilitoris TaxID=2772299 RepID=A0A927H537_9BACL|nr:ABC transporter permease [Paenibacillus arenilitoris]MBD2869071.1 ABC transporter permease [Paenibacillus arenilitoris]